MLLVARKRFFQRIMKCQHNLFSQSTVDYYIYNYDTGMYKTTLSWIKFSPYCDNMPKCYDGTWQILPVMESNL